MKTTMVMAAALAAALLTGCDKDKLAVSREGNAVVLKAARAEIRVEGDDATYPKAAAKAREVKQVGELNDGL